MGTKAASQRLLCSRLLDAVLEEVSYAELGTLAKNTFLLFLRYYSTPKLGFLLFFRNYNTKKGKYSQVSLSVIVALESKPKPRLPMMSRVTSFKKFLDPGVT